MSIPPEHAAGLEDVVRTVCSPNCSGTCGINVHVKNDEIVSVEPAAYPEPGFERICIKGIAMAMQRVDCPDRLRYPLKRRGKRGAGDWEQISWDQALSEIAAKLGKYQQETGPESIAWMTMSGNYGFKACTSPERIANCLGGTLFSHDGMMGDLSCAMGYLPLLGVGSVCNDLSDLPLSDFILIFGRNVAETDHSEMRFLLDAREGGSRVITVDPRLTRTVAKSDEWVQPRPGTDAALVLGMIHTLLEEGLVDLDYLSRHSNAPFLVRMDNGKFLRGADLAEPLAAVYLVKSSHIEQPVAAEDSTVPLLDGEFEVKLADGRVISAVPALELMRRRWQRYDAQSAAEICGVPAGRIRQLARDYSAADKPWIWAGAGPQRYRHGHMAHRAYVTLGALCGNIGKPYAGVNCLDGAHMRLTFMPPPAWVQPSESKARHLPGVHLQQIIPSRQPWPIRSLWLTSYGMATQSPAFQQFVDESLPQLDLFVVTEQVMTAAAAHADYVLPCVSYYEEELDLVAGGENWYLQLRQRAISPLGESRSDYEIFAALAQHMGCGEYWQDDAETICRTVLESHPDPSIRAVDWAALRREGVQAVPIPRPHVPFADLRFPTPSGRIELYTEGLLEFGEEILEFGGPHDSAMEDRAFPLTLLTPKHVYSAHATHTMLPWIRERLREPLLTVHPQDAAARGLTSGDVVRVFNDRGEFQLHCSVSAEVAPGVVSVPQGFWPRDYITGHPSYLATVERSDVQESIIETNYPAWEVAVNIAALKADSGRESVA